MWPAILCSSFTHVLYTYSVWIGKNPKRKNAPKSGQRRFCHAWALRTLQLRSEQTGALGVIPMLIVDAGQRQRLCGAADNLITTMLCLRIYEVRARNERARAHIDVRYSICHHGSTLFALFEMLGIQFTFSLSPSLLPPSHFLLPLLPLPSFLSSSVKFVSDFHLSSPPRVFGEGGIGWLPVGRPAGCAHRLSLPPSPYSTNATSQQLIQTASYIRIRLRSSN